MKTKKSLLTIALLALSSLVPGWGQNFTTGSNGSLGDLSLLDADQTVELPPDGRLHYKTIKVAGGRILRFKRNPLNTPVQLLAQGDIVIEGIIDVSGSVAPGTPPIGGAGGPGGFDGGKPGFGADTPPGDGYGPGAGGSGTAGPQVNSAGGAGYGEPSPPSASNSQFKGGTYGSPLLIPLMGGSGGGGDTGTPGNGGGGGGGAILVASNTKIRVAAGARIVSQGGSWRGSSHNAGSGGAIRLLAPKVEGNGSIEVQGGGSGGGAGRIRVDCLDKTALQLNFQPLALTTVGANMFVDPFTTPPPTPANDGNSNTILFGERRVPRLDIIAVAGQVIAPDTGSTVRIQLPFGSDTNRTVTVRAQDFTSTVPIRLTLTPDSGRRIVINSSISNLRQIGLDLVNGGSRFITNSVTIPIGLPANTLVTIHAWTREDRGEVIDNSIP